MGAAALSLIWQLDEAIQRGSRQKRVETLQRLTTLFVDSADHYSAEHVELFDNVFGMLVAEIETRARAELSLRLAPVGNAPIKLLRTLASDDDIAVAGPVLKLAVRLEEADLIDLANTKGQAHLHAIAARRALGEAITDILVRRGDDEVVRSLADNRGARISEAGFYRLVKRAETDGILAEKVGLRPDIPAPLFRELLSRATAIVHKRLLASAPPEVQAEIRSVLEKIYREVGARVAVRDFHPAQRVVLGLHRAGRMNEEALMAFASEGKYEETVVALAALAKVPIEIADRLMSGDRPDAILILCKAAGLNWQAVKAVIAARPSRKGIAGSNLDATFSDYGRLPITTALRIVRFWQVRQNG